MTRLLGGIALGILLAGCATKADKMIQPSANGLNVTFASASAKEGLIGFIPTTVRTVRDGRGITIQSEKEDFSADCKLVGHGFSAEFKSPKIVNLPSFGKDAKPATLTCMSGDEKVEKTYKVVNLSQNARTGNAMAMGILVSPLAGVIMAGTGAGDKTEDAYGFEDMTLEF